MQIALTGLQQDKAEQLSGNDLNRENPGNGPSPNRGKSFSHVLEKEQTKIQDKVKPEKDDSAKNGKNSPEKQETAKKELSKRLQQPSPELDGLFHFIYDLAHKNPAEWSIAEREHYGMEKGQVSLRDFHQMLSDRGLKLQDLSYDHLTQMGRLNTRRELSVFLDKLLMEMESGASRERPLEIREPFFGQKTSLHEIEKQSGVKQEQIIKEIVKQISMRKIREGTEVSLKLNHGQFGELKLGIIVGTKGITARFKTGNQQLKEILESHLDELAKGFMKQGLRVRELEVEKIS